MGDNRTDFDHAVPMSDDTAEQQRTDIFDAGVPMSDATAHQQELDTGTVSTGSGDTATDAKQTLKDNAERLGQQASEKARGLVEQGKERAGGALDQLSQMLTDAAGQVDDKLGSQYGQYARQAATSVQGFSDQVKNKDLDELLDDARGFVRKSPAVAIGAAAAIGFVLARLIQAGIDERGSDKA